MKLRTVATIVAFGVLIACQTDVQRRAGDGSAGPARCRDVGDPGSFVPATRRQQGKVIMPITFPDGSAARIVYPAGLCIAEFGAQPYSSGELGDCCARDFLVLYGGFPKSEVTGKAPLRTYRGVGGSQVEYWPMGASGHDPSRDRWLIFNFHPWYVLVWDETGGMTDEDLATWARGLTGAESEDGFLVLRAHPPLQLASPGQKAGPELDFYDREKSVSFFVGPCAVDEDDGKLFPLGGEIGPGSEWFGTRCFEDRSIGMHVQSENERFARGVIDGVEIRDVQVAS